MSSSSSYNTKKSIQRGIKCRCGIVAPCWEAWKDGTFDPGRRFYGCSRYKDPGRSCNFFQWAEPTFSERAREVIHQLKMKADALSEELRLAEDKIATLKLELSMAEEKNLQMEKKMMDKDGGKKICFLFVTICFIMWVSLK